MSPPQHRGRLSGIFEEPRHSEVRPGGLQTPPTRSSRGSVGSKSRRWESHSSNRRNTTRYAHTAHIPSTAEQAQIDRRAA